MYAEVLILIIQFIVSFIIYNISRYFQNILLQDDAVVDGNGKGSTHVIGGSYAYTFKWLPP